MYGSRGWLVLVLTSASSLDHRGETPVRGPPAWYWSIELRRIRGRSDRSGLILEARSSIEPPPSPLGRRPAGQPAAGLSRGGRWAPTAQDEGPPLGPGSTAGSPGTMSPPGPDRPVRQAETTERASSRSTLAPPRAVGILLLDGEGRIVSVDGRVDGNVELPTGRAPRTSA